VSHPAPVVKAYGSGHKGTPKKAGPQSILKVSSVFADRVSDVDTVQKPSGTASPTTKSPKNTKQQTQPQPQTQAQPQTEASAEALAFADVERLQCLLCSRVLKDRDMLIRHGLESDRHRTNLQDAVLREAAIRKKAALQSTSQAMPSSKKQTHFEGTANATPSKAVHASSMPAKSHGSPAPARGAPVAIKALAASSKTSSQHDILQGGVRFPPHIFDSMPAAPENADQRYFLLSCGGIDCQLWYSAVFDAEKKLLGHAVGAAKQEVIAAALQASKTKIVSLWSHPSHPELTFRLGRHDRLHFLCAEHARPSHRRRPQIPTGRHDPAPALVSQPQRRPRALAVVVFAGQRPVEGRLHGRWGVPRERQAR
jgi:hypothetical protein